MKAGKRIMAVMLAGCMLMSNIQIASAQENGDLSGEIPEITVEMPVSADAEADMTVLPEEAETYGDSSAVEQMQESAAVGEYVQVDPQSGSEENIEEDILVPEGAGTETGTAEEIQEEDLFLIPDEGETDPAVFVFGQEYRGYISEEEPLQKYGFTLEQDGSVQITAKAGIACVQYSILGQDEAVFWTAAPEWNPETGYSEITETVGLAAGTYSFAVGQTEEYAGEYSFRIEAVSAEQEQAAGLPETVEDNPADIVEAVDEEDGGDTEAEAVAEDNSADMEVETAAEEIAADTEAETVTEKEAADITAEEAGENVTAVGAEEDQEPGDGKDAAEEDPENDKEAQDVENEEAAEVPADGTLLQGGSSRSSAQTIKLGKTYAGTISGNQREHWYKFTVPSACNVKITARAAVNYVWYNLYDGNDGSTIWGDYCTRNSSSGYSICQKAISLKKGTYYFVVERVRSYTGNFVFEINVPVSGVKLNKTSQSIAVGKTAALKATVSPSAATNKNVTWKSSNTSVATVNSKGVVTGKKAGTATITVTTKDGSKKATCKVTVRVPVTGVKLNKTRQTLKVNGKVTLKATVSPTNATNKKVTWKSSNTSVAVVSSKGVVTARKGGTARITATTQDGKKAAACTVTVKSPAVTYRTHVQTYGWQGWKKNGAVSGTYGQAKRLEGINIKLANAPYSGGITYRTHIQTYGWEKSWKSNGAMSGTQGQAKRLEAIQIKLTGEMAKHYDVYYRVHAQKFGWMGWAKNGAQAGTAGYAYRLEGIQIVLVSKGGSRPSVSLGGQKQATSATFKKKEEVFKLFAGHYVFTSGIGGWATTMTLASDGSFTGVYTDFNYGENGYGYDSTQYYSKFSGRFINPKRINSYTYSFNLGGIQYENTPGTSRIAMTQGGNRMRWVYTDAYGLNNGTRTIYAYTESAPVSQLPRGFLSWVNLLRGNSSSSSKLSYKGLYAVEPQYGWLQTK